MDKITFVCDRGGKLVKALEAYQVVHCFPHRLNNVLKRTFYRARIREKLRRRQRKPLNKNKNDDQSIWNDMISNDNDSLMYYDDRDSSESESEDDTVLDEKSVELALRSVSASPEGDHVNVLEQNLPIYASQILTTIVKCKELYSYVKRVFFILHNEGMFF